jgi:hypothetical protein
MLRSTARQGALEARVSVCLGLTYRQAPPGSNQTKTTHPYRCATGFSLSPCIGDSPNTTQGPYTCSLDLTLPLTDKMFQRRFPPVARGLNLPAAAHPIISQCLRTGRPLMFPPSSSDRLCGVL